MIDGVDVIKHSIAGSSESSILDPVERAFRGASNAGVFVANSAGKSGPAPSTLDHPSPWLTTVAAATFRRASAAVELGNDALRRCLDDPAAPQAPEITDFSSRGPSTTTGGDILNPDIAAPGNDVVAAVAPPSNHGRSWGCYSGTSMSSPHVAGIGALLIAKHPDRLPSEVKSAIMTSARAIGALAGSQTVTRRVRTVTGHAAGFKSYAHVPGFRMTVTPSTISLAPNDEKTFTVTFARTTAPLGQWAIGRIAWTGGGNGTTVRSPVTLRPVALSAPAEVHGAASASGSLDHSVPTQVTSGTPKTLTAAWSGLDPAKGWFGVISYSGATDVTLFSVG